MAMKKSIGRTLAHIDVAANTSVRIHEDFFNTHPCSQNLMVTPASDQRVDPASGSSPSATRSDSNPDRVCPIDFIRGRFRGHSARPPYCFFAIVAGAPKSDLSLCTERAGVYLPPLQRRMKP